MARRRNDDVQARIEALPAAAPARFTAARDALARELEAAGDPRAGEVRALRRPTRRAWILNRVARDRPAEVDALLQAGTRLRQAHVAALGGRRGAGLRAADEAMSAALDALVESACTLAAEGGREADHALLAGARADLRAAATAGKAEAARLRTGSFERPPARDLGDAGWGLGSLPSASSTRAAPPTRTGRRAAPRRRSPTRPARRQRT